MTSKARNIANKIENKEPLIDILHCYQFHSTQALGSYMYKNGYRFNVSEHQYIYDAALLNKNLEVSVMDRYSQEEVSEEKVIHTLEEQMNKIKELLDGAYPIKLSFHTKQLLQNHCEKNAISFDEFIEKAILEKINNF